MNKYTKYFPDKTDFYTEPTRFAQKYNSELHLRRKPKLKWTPRKSMTVCISAICERHIVIGASDRMITSWGGLIQTSSKKSKSGGLNFRANDSIAVMIAGNMSLQEEILNKAVSKLLPQLTPDRLSVEQVLDAYTEAYREIYWRQAESKILVPQFLTVKSYKELQENPNSNLGYLEMIRKSLEEFHLSFKQDEGNSIQTIIAGVDHDGTHLYKLTFDDIEDCTKESFAVIGSGGYHAESHFQLNHYTSKWAYADALLLLYEAKKKAELTSGVDDKTDMFRLFPLPLQPNVPNFEPLSNLQVDKIAIAYDELQNEIEQVTANLKARITNSLHDSKIDYAIEGYERWLRTKSKEDETADFYKE